MEFKTENVEKKFEEIYDVSDWEVWSDQGFIPVERIGKTVPYQVWRLKIDDRYQTELYAADRHIVITTTGAKYVKDLQPGIDAVYTDRGIAVVLELERLDYEEEMYDLELEKDLLSIKKKEDEYLVWRDEQQILVDSSKIRKGDYVAVARVGFREVIDCSDSHVVIDHCSHQYYTNGILSHNTLFLTDSASRFMRQGKNVLYITLEMSKREIMKRIDANMLDIDIISFDEEEKLPIIEERFKQLLNSSPNLGEIEIIQFPTYSCSVQTVRTTMKKIINSGFRPDVLIVDQISSMTDLSTNLYERIKNITAGLKSIASEFNIAVLSAAQANREAIVKKEIDMGNIAESMGIAQISDIILMLKTIRSGSKISCKVEKNRISGTDFSKVRLELDLKKMKILDSYREIKNDSTIDDIIQQNSRRVGSFS